MADYQLDEINKSRLDGIVGKAVANNESEDTIKALVEDYKTKYGTPTTLRVKSEGLQRDVNPKNIPIGAGPTSTDFRETVGKEIPSLLANIGSYGGPIGGAIGSAAGEGLRQMSPENFGTEGLGTDLAFNSALPFGLGKLAKMFQSGPKGMIADALASKLGQKTPQVKNLMGAENDVMHTDLLKSAGFSSDLPDESQVRSILAKASEGSDKNSLLRYGKNKLVFSAAALAAGGATLGLAPTAAVGGSIVLGNEAIKRLTRDPEIASLLIKAIKTPSSSQESSLIGKTIFNALRGTQVTFQNSDGEKQPAVIDKDGNLTYPR